jgi:hypothetical protein
MSVMQRTLVVAGKHSHQALDNQRQKKEKRSSTGTQSIHRAASPM